MTRSTLSDADLFLLKLLCLRPSALVGGICVLWMAMIGAPSRGVVFRPVEAPYGCERLMYPRGMAPDCYEAPMFGCMEALKGYEGTLRPKGKASYGCEGTLRPPVGVSYGFDASTGGCMGVAYYSASHLLSCVRIFSFISSGMLLMRARWLPRGWM